MNKFIMSACVALATVLSAPAGAYVLTQTAGGNGSVQAVANGFTLNGTDYGDDFNAVNGGSYDVFYTQVFAVDTLISFNWSYVSNDMLMGWGIPDQDPAGYVLGGINDLASGADLAQSGSVTNLLVAAGQSFGWFVSSVDGLNGGASLTITNLVATSPNANAVPEPTGLALALAGMGLLGLGRRARKHAA